MPLKAVADRIIRGCNKGYAERLKVLTAIRSGWISQNIDQEPLVVRI